MRRRSGFTITELLVAMALIVFIMSIIATAFSEGMKTFRAFKGIGDMNQRLRIASALLKDDLSALHFEGDRRLSDPNFWIIGPPREGFFRIWQGSAISATLTAPYVNEGKDIDYQIQSVRATDHILHFTSKKLGNDPKNFYRAAIPPTSPLATFGDFNSRFQDAGTFTSQWAEIAWFMRANGNTANGTPLYTLYRRQRVVVPNPITGGTTNLNYPGIGRYTTLYNNLATMQNYLGISCREGGTKNNELIFNSPSDLTVPQYRFSMIPTSVGGIPPQDTTGAYPPGMTKGAYYYYAFQPQGTPGANVTEEQTNPNLQGADAVITDVISFAVQILTTATPTVAAATPTFGDIQQTIASTGVAPTNPLFNANGKPYVFDTWSTVTDTTDAVNPVDYSLGNNSSPAVLPATLQPKCVPLKIVITGIQIQLRVWDNKTEQTRQMTIVVDM